MKYKQKYPEACLAKCMLILIEKLKNIKVNAKKELEILNYAAEYDRENFTIGHLKRIIRDFEVKINWYVDTKIFYDFIKKRKIPKNTQIILSKINLKLIDQLLSKPLIIYLDQFYLWEKKMGLYYKYHYPHFVIVLKKIKEDYLIIDPNDGKRKRINKKQLSKSIISLKNHLWFSPQIIILK